jgi:hypothetical protein
MRTTTLAFVVLALAPTPVAAEPPPYVAPIAAWAKAAKYEVSAFVNCRGLEESAFGSLGSVCWHARATNKGDLHPRFDLTLAVFRDEAAAKRRIARFHEARKELTGEAEKVYPLRAAFRLGDRVMILTTDALAFEPPMIDAAKALAQATGGTELTCWGRC